MPGSQVYGAASCRATTVSASTQTGQKFDTANAGSSSNFRFRWPANSGTAPSRKYNHIKQFSGSVAASESHGEAIASLKVSGVIPHNFSKWVNDGTTYQNYQVPGGTGGSYTTEVSPNTLSPQYDYAGSYWYIDVTVGLGLQSDASAQPKSYNGTETATSAASTIGTMAGDGIYLVSP